MLRSCGRDCEVPTSLFGKAGWCLPLCGSPPVPWDLLIILANTKTIKTLGAHWLLDPRLEEGLLPNAPTLPILGDSKPACCDTTLLLPSPRLCERETIISALGEIQCQLQPPLQPLDVLKRKVARALTFHNWPSARCYKSCC